MKNMFDELPWLALTPTSKVYTLLYQRAQKTNSMLLVSGAKGAGKSKMLRHLANELSKLKNTWIAHVDATCDAPGQSIIDSLGKTDFSVDLTDYEAIILLLKQRQSFSQKTILLIDSADCLSQSIFDMLTRIIEQNRIAKHHFDFSIVFFSENMGLKHFLNVSESIQARYALPPLNPTQIKRLAEHAYNYVGIKRDFSVFDVSKLHAISHGYPGRLLVHISQDINLKNNTVSEMRSVDTISDLAVLAENIPNRVEKLYQHEVDAVHINKDKKIAASELTGSVSQATMAAVLAKKKYEQRNFTIIFFGMLSLFSVLLFSYAFLFEQPLLNTHTPNLNESMIKSVDPQIESPIEGQIEVQTEKVEMDASNLSTNGPNQNIELTMTAIKAASLGGSNHSQQQENATLPQSSDSSVIETRTVLPTALINDQPAAISSSVSSSVSSGSIVNQPANFSDSLEQTNSQLENDSKVSEGISQEIDSKVSLPTSDNSEQLNPENIKQDATYYVIRLSIAKSSKSAKNILNGIPVPGSAQLAKVTIKGRTQFITYIGPYSTKAQAQSGLQKLPTRLKELNPVIYSDLDLIKI